ncbi:hypothetical protein GQ53DRAFT_833222 [Thozetella sp. PMI_491]|nr:hypothetical protein GQ53DRAFT_833222 [Thozetella sp. PMI_491]
MAQPSRDIAPEQADIGQLNTHELQQSTPETETLSGNSDTPEQINFDGIHALELQPSTIASETLSNTSEPPSSECPGQGEELQSRVPVAKRTPRDIEDLAVDTSQQREEGIGNVKLQSEVTLNELDTTPRETMSRKLRCWIWEAIACVLALIGLFAIVTLLRTFDGQSLPAFPLRLSLNTVVAYLVTFTKGALMIPVAECIGQWKWAWFDKKRSLSDFETFDRASRGVWGSLSLMATSRWRHIVTLGAGISVLAIAASPFTQQAITYPVRPVVTDQSATVLANWNLKLPDGTLDPILSERSIAEGFTYTKAASTPIIPFCGTANCTFPRFQTLGVCTKLSNITSHVRTSFFVPSSDSGTAQNPNSLWKDPYYPNPVQYNVSLSVDGSWFLTPAQASIIGFPINNSIAFAGDAALSATGLWDMAIVYNMDYSLPFPPARDRPPPTFEAIEVIFHACVWEFETQVINGVPSTEPVASSYEVLSSSGVSGLGIECLDTLGEARAPWNMSLPLALVDYSCRPLNEPSTGSTILRGPGALTSNGTEAAPRVAAEYYTMNDTARPLMSAFFADYATPMFMENDPSRYPFSWSWGGSILSDYRYMEAVLLIPEDAPDKSALRFERLKNASEVIAVGATNAIRQLASFDNSSENSFAINGSAMVIENYVSIRWGWIAFLGSQVLLGIVFFVITVAVTVRRDVRVLKNCALAALSALSIESRATLGGLAAIDSMQKRSKSFKAETTRNGLVLST